MKTFLLTLTTASILLLSGCAMVPNTVLLGEHGCPKLELNEQNKVKTDLSAEFQFGMTEEDVRNIMKSEPIAYLPKNEQDVSWLRWYYSRETIKGQQWKCLSICADFKFVNGKLVGYAAGDGPKGDCNWSPEIRWTLFKITQPILTRHIDQKINRQMYFNDENYAYVWSTRGRIVDYWEGTTVHFKEEQLKDGYYRVHANKSYCDIPNNCEYLGYWNGAFHYRNLNSSTIILQNTGLNNPNPPLVNTPTIPTHPPMQSQPMQANPVAHPQTTTPVKHSPQQNIKSPNFKRICPKHGEYDMRAGGCPACRGTINW
ncbi:MAG: hypothetical protein IKP58_08185 [Victivallales bacterium]|nr:hypothetical protein [Victivallales bacterium]